MDDIEVIRRVKTGDAEAFSALVFKYHRRLLAFIYGLVHDESIVEDIGQEVFLSAYTSIHNFDERTGTPFSAWLFTIARNRCMSELRKKQRALKIPLDKTPEAHLKNETRDAESSLMEKERRQVIEESLEQIPEPFRGTLLRSLAGFTIEEIAGSDGVSAGTVKSRLFRARAGMKRLLQKLFGGKANENV